MRAMSARLLITSSTGAVAPEPATARNFTFSKPGDLRAAAAGVPGQRGDLADGGGRERATLLDRVGSRALAGRRHVGRSGRGGERVTGNGERSAQRQQPGTAPLQHGRPPSGPTARAALSQWHRDSFAYK